MKIRHTMGQDWGGRRKTNPEGTPKITMRQVNDYAKEIGVEVWREPGNYSMWWLMRNGKKYKTLGMTNFQALNYLHRLAE